MTNYDVFARFYDKAMGDRTATVNRILDLVKKYNPKSKTVLELACGTGAILKALSGFYDIHGIDISKGMLAIAKKTAPKAKLSHHSMVGFKLSEKFDVILCLFDSINHLLTFRHWENVFRKAHEHLNDGGLFIFDMNTQKKLEALSTFRPAVVNLGKDLMIMTVTSTDEKLTNWDIVVFEHKATNRYQRWQDNAKEISFPGKQVEKRLRQIYKKVWIQPAEIKRFNSSDGRLYFCCQKQER